MDPILALERRGARLARPGELLDAAHAIEVDDDWTRFDSLVPP